MYKNLTWFMAYNYNNINLKNSNFPVFYSMYVEELGRVLVTKVKNLLLLLPAWRGAARVTSQQNWYLSTWPAWEISFWTHRGWKGFWFLQLKQNMINDCHLIDTLCCYEILVYWKEPNLFKKETWGYVIHLEEFWCLVFKTCQQPPS